jgi:hypothetical protein
LGRRRASRLLENRKMAIWCLFQNINRIVKFPKY